MEKERVKSGGDYQGEKDNEGMEYQSSRLRRNREEKNAYYSAKPKFGEKGPSKLRVQFNRGITGFLVIAASLLFYFALLRATNLSAAVAKVIEVLMPFFYGCGIAYILNPIVKKVDKQLLPFLEKRMKNKEGARKLSRGTGVFLALLFMIILIVALCNMLIPELYFSIRNLIYTLPGQLNQLIDAINEMTTGESTTSAFLKTAVQEGSQMLENWLRTDLLPKTNEIMSNLTVGVINVISTAFDFVIGVIVSIYLLFSKEMFLAQGKKAIYAVFPVNHANLFLHFAVKSNEIFGGFIIGKVIDSAIIGVLCFFGLTILNMPYTLLVSVIVGVTNVIPFFGPYIGAIPSAILIMLNSPIQGLYFIIFILVLQQFDGNILGPKILGNSTGLSAFWVIVAILLGGSLFGFVGMLLGVPTFAVLYYMLQLFLNNRLEKKKLPVPSEKYTPQSYVDSDGKYRDGEE